MPHAQDDITAHRTSTANTPLDCCYRREKENILSCSGHGIMHLFVITAPHIYYFFDMNEKLAVEHRHLRDWIFRGGGSGYEGIW